MKAFVLLIMSFSSSLFAHPISVNPNTIDKHSVGKISWTPAHNILSYQFTLVHNDIARVNGRHYDKYSPFDRKYVSKEIQEIKSQIVSQLELNSDEGHCEIKGIGITSLPSIQINKVLEAPGHEILVKAICPSQPTRISNAIISKAVFPTLEKQEGICHDGKRPLNRINEAIQIPKDCFQGSPT